MSIMQDLALFAALLAAVVGSTCIGIRAGRRSATKPDTDQVGVVQSALLGLLALVLGFAFAGAMSRFTDRQDALASEAAAITSAYGAAAMLSDPDRARAHIRDYAKARVDLFNARRPAERADIEQRIRTSYDAISAMATRDAIANPSLGQISLPRISELLAQYAARNAFAQRHLPTEMIVVMILCSCAAMSMMGYGAGLAQRGPTAPVLTLAALITVTLFLTLDFDRPQHGLIRLDGRLLIDAATRINAHSTP